MKATMTFDGLSELIQIKVTVNFTNCSVTSITTWNNSARDFILAKPVKDQERIFQPISYQCFLVSLVSNLLHQLIRTLESTETKFLYESNNDI